jgi:hypothetical protein
VKSHVVARWVAARWRSQLWVWVAALTLFGLWSALQLLSPFGVLVTGGDRARALYEIAFMAGVAGVASALHAVDELRSWTRALGLRTGAFAEWVALCAGGVVFQLVALALPWTAALGQHNGLDLGLAAKTFVASAHLACGGLAVLRVSLPTGARAFAWIVAAWIIPAVAGPSSVLTLFQPIPPFVGVSQSRIVFTGELASMLALIATAYMLDNSARRDP